MPSILSPFAGINLEELKATIKREQDFTNRQGGRKKLEQNLNYEWTTNPDAGRAGSNKQKYTVNQVGLPVMYKENPSNSDLTAEPEVATGVPSFINPYALLSFPSRFDSEKSAYNTLIDDPGNPQKFSSGRRVSGGPAANGSNYNNLEPTVYNLVNSPPDGSDNYLNAKTPYRYTDFIYCKYYGIIPNNYLITLRRYPAPTFDNLAIPLEAKDGNSQYAFKPIAQAVTWLGEETENKISEILGFEVSTNWKLFESAVENVQGNEQSANEGPFGSAAKFLSIVSGTLGGNMTSPSQERNSSYDPYANGPYSHRVYGPVNVIAKTYKRDRGIDFKQSFVINFHYSLKSIAGINPKVAMLDIMSNMMQLTYNNAAFWGGANRYFAQRKVFPFIGGKEGMNAWYRGDPVAFTRAVGNQIKGVIDQLSSFFDSLASDPIGALKKLATNGASTAMKVMGQGNAPDIVALKALLTGEPIGEWHLVVGNPYDPIIMVGNLICTGAKFQFNDTLGADNFPTELKVQISLEHGRPRDKGDIESMFNQGEGRIYFAPLGKKDAFRSASQYNSANTNTESPPAGLGVNQQAVGNNVKTTSSSVPAVGTSRVGSTNKTNKKAKSVQQGKNTNNTKAPASSKDANLGNKSDFDRVIENVAYPFATSGHDLAIKMGLASAGVPAGGAPSTGNVTSKKQS